ncbi:uncharacterized protein LOC127847120 [Dreissena polymorpha]|uniref:uncharacterized protein LOC127847120 n=1 Tax=Dreissena polymorpha TaxID=45954 RepID=UPI0022653685|nr:uncharacterized protein LOC127847120 [Dreissena polymorpha]
MQPVPYFTGHARCYVYSGFATIKKQSRRCDVSMLAHLSDVMNDSSNSNASVQYPQWQWEDWQAFLQPKFRALPGIRKYQYFRFEQRWPGFVFARERHESEKTKILLTSESGFVATEIPRTLTTAGL